MLVLQFITTVACGLVLALPNSALAQRTPGEDPIKLESKLSYAPMPGGQVAKSTPLESDTDMPAWLRAKVARFEAKAYSGTADDGSILTDANVTNTSTTQGVRRTCLQEVASTTQTGASAGSAGARTTPTQQIVVLRGDLVNICR